MAVLPGQEQVECAAPFLANRVEKGVHAAGGVAGHEAHPDLRQASPRPAAGLSGRGLRIYATAYMGEAPCHSRGGAAPASGPAGGGLALLRSRKLSRSSRPDIASRFPAAVASSSKTTSIESLMSSPLSHLQRPLFSLAQREGGGHRALAAAPAVGAQTEARRASPAAHDATRPPTPIWLSWPHDALRCTVPRCALTTPSP